MACKSFFFCKKCQSVECLACNFFLLLARFHGKLHSRSFPELSSENVKEKLPVRQMSDNQPSITITKLNGNTKLPVASTKYEELIFKEMNY